MDESGDDTYENEDLDESGDESNENDDLDRLRVYGAGDETNKNEDLDESGDETNGNDDLDRLLTYEAEDEVSKDEDWSDLPAFNNSSDSDSESDGSMDSESNIDNEPYNENSGSSSGDESDKKPGLSRTRRNVQRRKYARQVRDGVRRKQARRGRPRKYPVSVKRPVGRPRKSPVSSKKKRQAQLDIHRYQTKKKIAETKHQFENGRIQEGLGSMMSLLSPTDGQKISNAVTKAFQPVHQRLTEHKTFVEVGQGTCELLKQVEGPDARSLTRWCGSQVTDKRKFAALIARPIEYVSNSMIPSFHPKQFNGEMSKTCQTRHNSSDMLGDIVEDFFLSQTHVMSGSKSDTRCLMMGFEELKREFFCKFPSLLREYARLHPEVISNLQDKSKKPTSFEARLLLAVEQSKAPDFDQEREITSRRQQAENKYEKVLLTSYLRRKGFALEEAKTCADSMPTTADQKQEAKKRTSYTKEDIQRYIDSAITAADQAELEAETTEAVLEIKVPGMRVFWGIINDRRIRWTVKINPTECRYHDEGPLWIAQLEEFAREKASLLAEKRKLTDQMEQLSVHPEERSRVQAAIEALALKLRKLEGCIRVKTTQIADYKRHLQQYETCRPIVKALEGVLTVGEALVYRDFVAQYDFKGRKVNNLVFVVLWRTQPEGSLSVFKLNHICSVKDEQAHDSYYVADVFDFYFRRHGVTSDFFRSRGIDRIFISGDHGPHFVSKATIYNESCFYERYGVRVHCYFLCSYHAYNRCDSAGVESKRIAKLAARQREGLQDAEDIRAALNASKYHNSYAYRFDEVRRDEHVFAGLKPKDKNSGNSKELMKKCEIKYEYVKDGKLCMTSGIVLFRDIPSLPQDKGGEPGEPFEVRDLRDSPPEGPLCESCSKAKQYPVWHKGQLCPRAYVIGAVLHEKTRLCNIGLAGPSAARIDRASQNQIAREKKDRKATVKRLNQTGKMGDRPCRFPGCAVMHLSRVSAINKHMMNAHNLKPGDPLLYETAQQKKERERATKLAEKQQKEAEPRNQQDAQGKQECTASSGSSSNSESDDASYLESASDEEEDERQEETEQSPEEWSEEQKEKEQEKGEEENEEEKGENAFELQRRETMLKNQRMMESLGLEAARRSLNVLGRSEQEKTKVGKKPRHRPPSTACQLLLQ